MSTTTEKGDSYELFVLMVYQAINKASVTDGIENLSLERNKSLPDCNGVNRQIDIYWEYELLGETFAVAIECKNYNSFIGIDKVEAFSQKLKSLRLNKGIMATRKGFQSGAIKTAEGYGISLIVIREPLESDWDGAIAKVNIEINMIPAPRIIRVSPVFDKEWMEEQFPDAKEQAIHLNLMNTEVFVNDLEKSERKDFRQIAQTLPGEKLGLHTHRIDYKNAFFEWENKCIKLKYIEFEYESFGILMHSMQIDITKFIIAFMEYVTNERRKIAVLLTGESKKWE